jgi:hypothetical protein
LALKRHWVQQVQLDLKAHKVQLDQQVQLVQLVQQVLQVHKVQPALQLPQPIALRSILLISLLLFPF